MDIFQATTSFARLVQFLRAGGAVAALDQISSVHFDAARQNLKLAETESDPDTYIDHARENFRVTHIALDKKIRSILKSKFRRGFEPAHAERLLDLDMVCCALAAICCCYLGSANDMEYFLNGLRSAANKRGETFEAEGFFGFYAFMAGAALGLVTPNGAIGSMFQEFHLTNGGITSIDNFSRNIRSLAEETSSPVRRRKAIEAIGRIK